MNARGNLRAGAERINATTLRSTALFVLGTAVDAVETGGTVGTVGTGRTVGARSVGALSLSVTIRTATCAASWPPLRATKCATRNPFTARLHKRAAGTRRRLAKVDASRHCPRRRTGSATGG